MGIYEITENVNVNIKGLSADDNIWHRGLSDVKSIFF